MTTACATHWQRRHPEGSKESARMTKRALPRTTLPKAFIQTFETRAEVTAPLLDQYIGQVIPRGGSAFVREILQGTWIVVMGLADGLCATYLGEFSDKAKAK